MALNVNNYEEKEPSICSLFQDLKLDSLVLLIGESPFTQQIRYRQIASISGYFESLSSLLPFLLICIGGVMLILDHRHQMRGIVSPVIESGR